MSVYSATSQFSLGNRLEITFKLKDREWNGKDFTNLQAINVKREKIVESNGESIEDVPFKD